MNERAFEQITAAVDVPMAIVTARAGDEQDGCLVGFTTQCSIDPPRYLVCLSRENKTYEIAQVASTLVVHVLRDEPHDRSLARLFGEETAYDVDKLSKCDWRPGPGGAPVITGCDWFAGTIIERVQLGDHDGFLLEVGGGDAARAAEPHLGFTKVRDLDAGNPP